MKKITLLIALIIATDAGLFAQVKIGANPTQIVSGAKLQVDGDNTVATPAKFIVTDAGNIGIGTAAPGTSLDVNGAITNRETNITTVTGGSVTVAVIPANISQARLTGSAVSVILAGMLGTPNPGQRLIIYNNTSGGFSARFNGFLILNGQAAAFTYSNGAWINIANGAGTNSWRITGNAGTNPTTDFIGTTDNTAFVTRTNNTERIRVMGSGNIGINTVNPGGRVQVSGDSAATIDILQVSSNNCGEPCPGQRLARNIVLHNINGTNSEFASVAFVPSTTATNPEGASIMGIDRNGSKNLAGLDFRTRDTAGTTGNMLSRLVIRSGGRVGIGTTAPDQLLSVNGNASKTGGGTWAVFSDRRLKKEVRPFTDGLEQVMQINPVFFKYNGKGGINVSDKDEVGVIAQEIQPIAPYTVTETEREIDGSGKGLLQLDRADAVTYMLVNAIKEQNAQIQELKEQLRVQEHKTASLRSELKKHARRHGKSKENNTAGDNLTAKLD